MISGTGVTSAYVFSGTQITQVFSKPHRTTRYTLLFTFARADCGPCAAQVSSRPQYVLIANMLVATFASMWITNVAAPVLCFSLLQPILRTLPSGHSFAKSLVLGEGSPVTVEASSDGIRIILLCFECMSTMACIWKIRGCPRCSCFQKDYAQPMLRCSIITCPP